MAVVPIRKPVIEEDAQPNPSDAKVTVGDDGTVTIEIGSSKPARKERPKGTAFDRNLAEDLDEGSLQTLAAFLLEGIDADIQDRAEWLETADRAASFLGIKLEDPVSEVAADGTICQMVATCMLEAAVKLWSTSYAELLPVGGPVKVERADSIPVSQLSGSDGGQPAGGVSQQPPPGGIVGAGSGAEPGQDPVTASDAAGDDLAQALEQDMNWYLTTSDRGYYPDTSKMLMARNKIGLGFKEVFRCPIERKPLSRWVMAQDLIIQGDPAHLTTPGHRVTKRAKVARSVMRRLQVSGYYRDIPLVQPTGETSNTEVTTGETVGIVATPTLLRDFEHTVYECSCELGEGLELPVELGELSLDETGVSPGYPIPYRVSIDLDSRVVVRIVRNWKKGDQDHRAKRRFVKYGFIPGDSFYDFGLIHLIGNPTYAATMLQRSGVDAALLANFPAWIGAQGPATRNENTTFRPNPGEVIRWPITGNKIQDALMSFPYKEPSPQSMALGQKLEGDAKRIAGVIELPVGEGRLGNTPVGTIMSYIESVSMVPGAVHKADHIAQAEEFELLRELLAEEPECLWRGNANPARKWQVAEEMLSPNLSPKADPNTPSQMHRLLKVQGQIMLGGLPQFQGIADNRAIYKRATEILSGEDAAQFTLPVPPQQAPPPDPKIVAAQIKAQSEQQQGEQRMQETLLEQQGKEKQLAQTSADKAADREAEGQRELLKLSAQHLKTGADMVTAGVGHAQAEAQAGAQRQHEAQQTAAGQQHEQGMASLASDGDEE